MRVYTGSMLWARKQAAAAAAGGRQCRRLGEEELGMGHMGYSVMQMMPRDLPMQRTAMQQWAAHR
jgi:hypothetical protein